MKKNLFLTALAAGALGCSSNEVFDNTAAGGSNKIEFTPVVGKPTRASEIHSTDLQKNGTVLNLYGYKTAEVFASRTSIPPFFTNTPEALTFNGLWSTSEDYEWTSLQGGYLSIFTYYSPKSVITGITAPTRTDAASFSYTVPNAIADQEDLLVSTNLDMTKANSGGLIAINFKHALSQLYFKAKLTSTGYKAVIKSIKVLGAQNTSTFTYATAKTGAGAGTWGATSGAVNYIYANNSAQKIISKDIAERIVSLDGSLMLMPQTANANTFKFEVTYDVYDNAGNVIGARVVKSADMAALEMGKKYAYTLILPATENDNIAFDVSVSDWDATTVATEREVRFGDYKLTGTGDDTAIADLITGYAPSVIYLHKIKITADRLGAPLAIDLSGLTAVAPGSKIILDCTIIEWDANTISVTGPSGWSVSSALSADGEITVTKD